MILRQIIGKFLVGRLCKRSFLPQVGCQVAVSVGNGSIRGLGCNDINKNVTLLNELVIAFRKRKLGGYGYQVHLGPVNNSSELPFRYYW